MDGTKKPGGGEARPGLENNFSHAHFIKTGAVSTRFEAPREQIADYLLLMAHPAYFTALDAVYLHKTAAESFSLLNRRFPEFPVSLIKKTLNLAMQIYMAKAVTHDQ